MDDHLIRSKKINCCRLCNNDLENKPWISQWEGNQHYKVNICDNCGKKQWITVDFEGSGHDHWKPSEEDEE